MQRWATVLRVISEAGDEDGLDDALLLFTKWAIGLSAMYQRAHYEAKRAERLSMVPPAIGDDLDLAASG